MDTKTNASGLSKILNSFDISLQFRRREEKENVQVPEESIKLPVVWTVYWEKLKKKLNDERQFEQVACDKEQKA